MVMPNDHVIPLLMSNAGDFTFSGEKIQIKVLSEVRFSISVWQNEELCLMNVESV